MIERRKFSSILARLYSDQDGERLAALNIATRMLRDEGLTWETAIFGSEVARRKAINPVSDTQPSFVTPMTGMTIAEQIAYIERNLSRLSFADRMNFETAKRVRTPRNIRYLIEIVNKLKGKG